MLPVPAAKPAAKPKSFEALTPELSQWILDFAKAKGFERTTPVQAMAIPLLIGNKDLVVEAVTGSGKTLSFLIPLVERLLRAEEPNKKHYIRAIVIAPTKELATQIFNVLLEILEHHPSSAAAIHPPADLDGDEGQPPGSTGGVHYEAKVAGPSTVPQLLVGGTMKLREDLDAFRSKPANVLIATPKRLLEFIGSSKAIIKEHWFDLLVLDEADRLLDPNFSTDIQSILELLPKQRRTGLFSASVSEAVDQLMRVGMRYPFKISAKVRSRTGALDKRTPESLRMCYVTTKASYRLPMLHKLIHSLNPPPEKLILYVSTRAGVDYWQRILPSVLRTAQDPISVIPLHGDYKSVIRSKNLTRFRDATGMVILLTTDVLARGIDIPDVDLVVHLDPPSQPKDFIHRCGRTGRAGRRGMAITFLAPQEQSYIDYLDVQGTKVEPYPNPPDITNEEASEACASIRKVLLTDRQLYDRAQRAFPSWVQAYTKTLPLDIFDVSKIDWLETARAWGLLRWPKMPELKRHGPPEIYADRTFGLGLPEDFDILTLAYKDKVREARRKAAMQAHSSGDRSLPHGALSGKQARERLRKEKAWSGQKDAKDLRDTRRDRKEAKRKAERSSKLTPAEKAQDIELEELVARIKEQNAEADDFDGFSE